MNQINYSNRRRKQIGRLNIPVKQSGAKNEGQKERQNRKFTERCPLMESSGGDTGSELYHERRGFMKQCPSFQSSEPRAPSSYHTFRRLYPHLSMSDRAAVAPPTGARQRVCDVSGSPAPGVAVNRPSDTRAGWLFTACGGAPQRPLLTASVPHFLEPSLLYRLVKLIIRQNQEKKTRWTHFRGGY